MNEDLRAPRVLVVEDELLIRWSITETLAHAGHTVIEAVDGASAIVALKNDDERIDAVVLDYRLPDSNDLTLLATVRRLLPDGAVVLMTAFGTPEVVKGALDLGVYQVLHNHSRCATLNRCFGKPAAPATDSVSDVRRSGT